jgi:hypothetical protein
MPKRETPRSTIFAEEATLLVISTATKNAMIKSKPRYRRFWFAGEMSGVGTCKGEFMRAPCFDKAGSRATAAVFAAGISTKLRFVFDSQVARAACTIFSLQNKTEGLDSGFKVSLA